ncbi:similar to hypothetical protein FLJ21827, isoform CRA_c [Rattus norvegicus]|uniref:Uncharacterized protein RGD1307682 n=1 Tax=Rattus norvegicus TaxID=10116 RepID=A6J412_RAT|nr:similar to hypothetical protein FLJ21827, isoform CRA_c [Rattus norvegicus]
MFLTKDINTTVYKSMGKELARWHSRQSVLTTQPDHLSPVPGTHVVEGENHQHLSSVNHMHLHERTHARMHAHACTHAHTGVWQFKG